jgi:hypothetical protein
MPASCSDSGSTWVPSARRVMTFADKAYQCAGGTIRKPFNRS